MSPSSAPTYRTLSGFFLPLAIQAASQALSYPLVAMVASRGPGGPLNLAGLAQSNTVMFFLGVFAISSVTTGMVYAKTREGYLKFRLMIRATGLAVIGIQAVLCIAKEIFIFNIPLSVGGYFLVASAIILAAFIARAPDPDRILPIYYLALGLANPMSFAATRLQAVVIAFPPQSPQERRTLRFCLAAGTLLGMLPLIFILPGSAEFYYVTLQKLNPADLDLVRMTAVSLIFFPLSVAIRAQSEGLAAWLNKPTTVLTGHGIFLVTIIVAGFTLLILGTPGQVIGAVGLTLGSLASSATMRLLLMRARERAFPVGQTTTSLGQIR